ncbi:MAG: phospholipase D-like domain-containing protein [Deltaproteobacteria bacterium]|nr:phospholipase D-like domain-containing protein [Deltaproteobacteria bacterium]
MGWLKWLFLGFDIILALFSAGHALLYKRNPRAAFGWIALCLTFPLAGPLLYFIFGINRINTRARELHGKKIFALPAGYERLRHESKALLADFNLPDDYFVPAGISHVLAGNPLTRGNRVEPLFNGEEAYPAMLEAIDSASERVYLSTYIFESDKTGNTFIDALAGATARGVDVRVLIDGFGEWYSLPRSGSGLRKKGVGFFRYLPPTFLPPFLHINLRNHRKLLVADGKVAFTGGMNIRDRHLEGESNRRKCTTDIHFKLVGSVVNQLEQAFLKDWDFASGGAGGKPAPFHYKELSGNALCRTILDGPDEDIDKLIMIFISSIATARKKITILTPYFLPPRELIGALQAAALRGVDVTLVLPEKNNHLIVHWAMRNMLWELVQWGVEVCYQPPPFAHGKLFLVDDHYLQIGSANFDARSLRLNFELMVEVYDEKLARKLAGYVEERRLLSRKLSLEELDGRALPVRLRDALCWLFSPYL